MSQITTTSQAERIHIALFGRCNSGKSSLMNRLTGSETAIVSDIAGTTTDPVTKAVEFPQIGAALLIDTPGLDDHSALGDERITRTHRMLDRTDVALLLFSEEPTSVEISFVEELQRRRIPIVAVLSKCDLYDKEHIEHITQSILTQTGLTPLLISSTNELGINELRQAVVALVPDEEHLLTAGFCEVGDVVLLVMPQDASAPKERLIKPQVQTIRELLDRGCIPICCTPERMEQALSALATPPKLIITDSQAFDRVYALKPSQSLLTSFSILFARYKGDMTAFLEGARHLATLTPQSRVLIAEACAHAPQSEDIGRVKLPRMLRRKVGEGLQIDVVGGNDFPKDLTPYDLVIHCGACMFNRRHVLSRTAQAAAQGVPITNYGIAIAALQGILDRVKTLP